MAAPDSNQQLINTTVLSTLNIEKPEKRNKLYQVRGIDQGLYDLLETVGYDRMVSQTEVSHFEQPWIHETIKVKTGVSDPGAGNALQITLDPDSLDSNNNFYPQQYDNVTMPAGNNHVRGQITSIDTTTPSAPVLTIYPLNSSDTLGAVSADDIIKIYSNQWGEGTDQPDNIVSTEDEYTFPSKIIKGAAEATGTAMVNQLWYDTLSISGEDASNKYLVSKIEEDARMKMRMEMAMWEDVKTTNTSNVSGESMWGIWDWTENGGNVSEITPGQFSMVDFDVMENTLDQEQAPNELFGCLGTRLYQDVENTLNDYFNNGAVVYANFLGGNKTAQDINMDFKSIEKTNRKYHFKKMSLFNHPKLPDRGSWGVFMPMDIRKQSTPSGDRPMPSISKFYLGQGRYSRKMEIWRTGAADGTYTNETDKQKTNYRGQCGIEMFGSNRWYLIKAKNT